MVADGLAEKRQRLLQFLNGEMEGLQGILRVYLQRAGLAGNEETTGELLNSVVVEALSHAEKYDPARPPRAWLLGIAANLVRRRQSETARLNQREPLAADLLDEPQRRLGEDELFEILAAQAADPARPGFDQALETRDRLTTAMGLLSVDERRLVRLFAQGGLDGEALAAALHVQPGTARVRLHRALAHLRRVWFFTEEKAYEQR
jgi:RNA polymerase sigma-70 factor (ECF subfamily)